MCHELLNWYYPYFSLSENQLSQLQKWTDEDEIYYHETNSYQATENMVKLRSVVCLVGAMGCGKTASARHLALEYKKEEE